MFTMSYTSGVWRDDPRVPLRFQLALRAPEGPVLGPDQAVLRRLTLGGRTVPTPFFAAQRVTARDRITPRDRGFRPCHRTTLCSQLQPSGSASSVWARHSETLLTPDCAAAARAEATVQSFENYTNVEVMSTTPIYNLPIQGDCPDAGFLLAVFAVVPFHHPTHHSHGKKDGYRTHLTDGLTYFQTHGELHKGPCTFSLTRQVDLPVISLGIL